MHTELRQQSHYVATGHRLAIGHCVRKAYSRNPYSGMTNPSSARHYIRTHGICRQPRCSLSARQGPTHECRAAHTAQTLDPSPFAAPVYMCVVSVGV